MKIFKSRVIRTLSRKHDPELSKTVQSRKLRLQIKLRITRTMETKVKRREPRRSLKLTEYQLSGFYRSATLSGIVSSRNNRQGRKRAISVKRIGQEIERRGAHARFRGRQRETTYVSNIENIFCETSFRKLLYYRYRNNCLTEPVHVCTVSGVRRNMEENEQKKKKKERKKKKTEFHVQ